MERNRDTRIKDVGVSNIRLLIDGIIIGIVGGMLSIFYRFIFSRINDIRFLLFKNLNPIITFSLLIIIGFIIGKLLEWEPLSSRSGISQVKAELIGDLDMNSERLIFSKIIGGGLSNLGGLSLGRAGPSIQIGAAGGKKVARLMDRDIIEERYMIMAGASAGLSASFNAPLSGTIFALKELNGKFSLAILLPCIVSSSVAHILSRHIFGFEPVFSYKIPHQIPPRQYYNLLFLAIITTIMGLLFNRMILLGRDIFNRINIENYYKTIVIMLISGLVAYISYDLLGSGDKLLDNIIILDFSIKVLIMFFIGKLLFTMLSYGSGAPGGTIFPSLVLGGLIGFIYFRIFNPIIGLADIYYITFIVYGMAGIMAVVMRSPIFSIVLISEITASANNIIALSFISVIAYLLGELLSKKPYRNYFRTK